jgi:1,4-alpha-glucan branching enzyme
VQVTGDWTGWRRRPLEMRSTMDGAYWWAEVPVDEVVRHSNGDDYHGLRYKFLLNGTRLVQDPAAGWVENSNPASASRLLRHSRFRWTDAGWRIPGWDHLIVYQLHPARFSGRFGHAIPPLLRVARELEDKAGYLRGLGVTALLLMPVNEVGSINSWGYDPAFFYAVEESYGGPDALKQLVDTCHRHGIAVLLDVVFNHAGTTDNVLWPVARSSFFDGDTQWGAMINFDHPQCRHFFEQNLVYFQREYHIDGFRLDHTHTIVHSDKPGWFVTQPGSGGGWEFLDGLRRALHGQADRRCILTAEHLPNEWAVTNYPGPMDSQWCDDFHDRLVDACAGQHVMPQLAEAMLLSHTACDDWFKVTNYPESHDEVGNVNSRIAWVAGQGRGLRMAKVAATMTLFSRGIPMWFMGAESGEHRQFHASEHTTLDLDRYLASDSQRRVRSWWQALCGLRRNPNLKGPAPLRIHHAQDQTLVLSRGMAREFFVVCNFGWSARRESLARLGMPDGSYRELWNSTWPAFAVEHEDEHTNGGRNAHLRRDHGLNIPDYGAVVLQRR